MAASINRSNIRNEIVNFLRNQNIISTTNRGVTTSSDTGTFTAASTHTLGTAPTLVKNIRSVIVAGSTLKYGTDYQLNLNTGVITFTSAQTGAYTITYDQGSSDRIFPDFAQIERRIGYFDEGAIAFKMLDSSIKEVALGGGTTRHDYVLTIVMYHVDTEELDDLVSSVENAFLDNKKKFTFTRFATPIRGGPILNDPAKKGKVLYTNLDVALQLNYQTV